MRRAVSRTLLTALVTLLSACAASPPATPAGAQSQGLPPAMTIERFLRAANQNDLSTMATLFGTREGAWASSVPTPESDQRMFLLASLLRHSDYSIGSEQVVPGRRDTAARYLVTVKRDQRSAEVPFTLVRTADAHWLIEDICVERITHGPTYRCTS